MKAWLWLGRISGALGALLCAVSVIYRLLGNYWIAGFQVGTLLQAGVAALTFACFCLLLYLSERA
jgi:hypothetical protein